MPEEEDNKFASPTPPPAAAEPAASAGETGEVTPIVNRPASKKQKFLTRLRTYFYVLRCWSRYGINARVKAAFVLDVHHAQFGLHHFKQWHEYVRIVRRLRGCLAETREVGRAFE
jgi:hypothetical protein